jgi:hypothetical protein
MREIQAFQLVAAWAIHLCIFGSILGLLSEFLAFPKEAICSRLLA